MIERLKVNKGDFVTGITLLALVEKIHEIVDYLNKAETNDSREQSVNDSKSAPAKCCISPTIALSITKADIIEAMDKDIYHGDSPGFNGDPEKLCLGEILTGINIDRLAQVILERIK